MKNYYDLLKYVYEKGVRTPTRSGIDQFTVLGLKIEHDLQKGFPLITNREMNLSKVASELEFFIKGYTDKTWLQKRHNHIWDHWANPQKAPYGTDDVSKKNMLLERDLGPVYGFQWRHFGAQYRGYDADYTGKGVDQFAEILNELKQNPYSKRLVVNAWNPTEIFPLHKSSMALPPCEYSFEVHLLEDTLNLVWHQRAADMVVGLPHNLASNALLLHLLSKETGYKEGKVIGMLSNAHIYENNFEDAKTILSRDPSLYVLPTIQTNHFESIFDWKYTDTKLNNYKSHPKMNLKVAV